MMAREGRLELAQACFDFLPIEPGWICRAGAPRIFLRIPEPESVSQQAARPLSVTVLTPGPAAQSGLFQLEWGNRNQHM